MLKICCPSQYLDPAYLKSSSFLIGMGHSVAFCTESCTESELQVQCAAYTVHIYTY